MILENGQEVSEEQMNELEKRAKAHKKKLRGITTLNPDAGNVEYNMSMFNKVNSPMEGPCNNPVSGPFGGDVCAESLDESNNSYQTPYKTIVEDTEITSKFLSSIRNEFNYRGQLRIGSNGVRFVSLEDDFAQYISREEFDNYVRRCLQDNMPVEDIAEDIPWEHTISIHHWFETENYKSSKRELDLQYGLAKETTRTVKSNNQSKRNNITFTELKKQKAAIVPYVAECMNILREDAFRMSVKVIGPSNCIIVVTMMGGGIEDIRAALRDVQVKFPGELTVSWGKDCSDWRLSRYNVQLTMPEDTLANVEEMLTEARPSKKETIELEYKNLEFTQYGAKRDVDDWDEWDSCMDWTYEVDKDDLYIFIFESCIDENDFPEAFEDDFDPNDPEHWARFESWLDDNFDAIYSKYEEKILENWEEDAAEEAAEEYDPDDYVDWDSMPGGHDDDRYWEDLTEGEEVFMEKYSYGLNEEYKREPKMIDYFEQMNSEEDEA